MRASQDKGSLWLVYGSSVHGYLSDMEEAYEIMCRRMHMAGNIILQYQLVEETITNLVSSRS